MLRTLCYFLFLSSLSLSSFSAFGNEISKKLAFVFADESSDDLYGEYPYSRDLSAKIVLKLKEAGADAVVLKQFLESPSDSVVEDRALADAMASMDVYLQMSLRASDNEPPILPSQFLWAQDRVQDLPHQLEGYSGWIPLPMFTASCKGVGFTDIRQVRPLNYLPLVGHYRDLGWVPSLGTCILERCFGQKLKVVGSQAFLGKKSIFLNDWGELSIDPNPAIPLESASIKELLEGKIAPDFFKDKVVIYTYAGPRQSSFVTSYGLMRGQLIFCRALVQLYQKLENE